MHNTKYFFTSTELCITFLVYVYQIHSNSLQCQLHECNCNCPVLLHFYSYKYFYFSFQALAGERACYNSIVSFGNQMLLLGTKTFHVLTIRSWIERLNHLIKQVINKLMWHLTHFMQVSNSALLDHCKEAVVILISIE